MASHGEGRSKKTLKNKNNNKSFWPNLQNMMFQDKLYYILQKLPQKYICFNLHKTMIVVAIWECNVFCFTPGTLFILDIINKF